MAATAPENTDRMRWISSCSWLRSCRMRAFSSTTALGSTNSVAPEEETSWITPPTSPRNSALTGTTKRPLRMLTTASCKYFWVFGERIIFSSRSRMPLSAARILRRMSYSASLAVSAISVSDKMLSEMLRDSPAFSVME